jgi:retron-type reverse transcriptase
MGECVLCAFSLKSQYNERYNMPKTYNNLAHRVYDFENLDQSFNEVRRNGKRYKPEILRFRENYEENLINLQNKLIWGMWEPHEYREFTIYEPKMRKISAPLVEDRVVHHALCRVIEPLFDSKMIYGSYACRKGKGMLSAAKRVQHYIRQHPAGEDLYYLKIDFHKYFHSIPHPVLKQVFRKVIRDPWIIALMDKIIDSYPRGLPIGALTSQLMANVVLDQLDHHITDMCGVRFYARYMDDICIVSGNRRYLEMVFDEIEDFSTNELHLVLNDRKSLIKVAEYYYDDERKVFDSGIDFCGYGVHRSHLTPRKRNVRAAKKRHKKLARLVKEGSIPADKLQKSLDSFTGYMTHCRWDAAARRAFDAARV